MSDNLSNVPVTQCMGKVTLAAGTTTTISNTGTTVFAIRGKAYSKSAMSNAATPTVDANGKAFRPIIANQGTIIIVGFDKDGNVKAMQGSIEALDASGAFTRAPELPVIPDTMCPVGYIVLKGGSTLVSTWTFGTNNLSSVTGMTYTFGDLIGMPDRPIIS